VHKAFDTKLEVEVEATLVARNGGCNDQYRFECAYCGEEVDLAAAQSIYKTPHFRHHHGNNDTECENYLGQHKELSWNSSSKKSRRENVSIYYHNNNKLFTFGIRFSEAEIDEYERLSASIEIIASPKRQVFESRKINHLNFYDSAVAYLPISIYSEQYLVQTTDRRTPRAFPFLKTGGIPTLFKIQGNDNNYKAKLVSEGMLYTNTRYLAILHSKSMPSSLPGDLPKAIQVERRFHFESMGREFVGAEIAIESKTISVEGLLRFWGYGLEASEKLTLLWPPAALCDEKYVVDSDAAVVYSTFELQAHGNVNVPSVCITRVEPRASIISIKPNTKIFRRNAEMVITPGGQIDDIKALQTMEVGAKQLAIPDDKHQYFLFNDGGVMPLHSGQIVRLAKNSNIKCYKSTYVVCRYKLPPNPSPTGKQLLEDILRHSKREAVFDSSDFSGLNLSATAHNYLEECEARKTINAVARQWILGGAL
jgi:hypothetical protein